VKVILPYFAESYDDLFSRSEICFNIDCCSYLHQAKDKSFYEEMHGLKRYCSLECIPQNICIANEFQRRTFFITMDGAAPIESDDEENQEDEEQDEEEQNEEEEEADNAADEDSPFGEFNPPHSANELPTEGVTAARQTE
jgi:hypothetical protein